MESCISRANTTSRLRSMQRTEQLKYSSAGGRVGREIFSAQPGSLIPKSMGISFAS